MLTLYGVKKDKSNVIVLGKSKEFYDWFGKFLLDNFNIDESLISCHDDLKKPHTDFYEGFSKGNTRIDVVYGSKRIFVIVKCTDLQKKKMFKYLHKTTKWTSKR